MVLINGMVEKIKDLKIRFNDNYPRYDDLENEIKTFGGLLLEVGEDYVINNKSEVLKVVEAYNKRNLDIVTLASYHYICYINYGVNIKDILNVLKSLKHLDGFDVNKIITIKDYTISGDRDGLYYPTTVCGRPLYYASNNAQIFKWCLENGADLKIKADIKPEYEYFNNECRKNFRGSFFDYELSKIKGSLKYDSLDCKDYIYKIKKKSFTEVYNNFVGSNKNLKVEIKTFADLVNAIKVDNRDIFDNLVKYKDIIYTGVLRGKNLLMYAIEENRLDWASELINNKLINKDDVNSVNQSALCVAVNRKRPYMVKLLMDNKIFAKSDEKDGLELFLATLWNYPKLAAKFEVHKMFNIDMDKFFKLYGSNNIDYYSSKYQSYLNKELSDYEKSLMTLDLEDLGVKKENIIVRKNKI